jgi:hypothetical protein
MAAELGVLGLLAVAALTVAAVRAALWPRAPGWHRLLRIVVAIELFTIGVHALAETYAVFEDPMSWAGLAVLASLSLPLPAGSAASAPATRPARVYTT